MRAVVQDRYGGLDALRAVELDEPTPGPGQVLIRVEATSINLSDWETLRGAPLYARIGGLRRPARPVLGSDIAGRVEAVGPEVVGFAVGDEVYGDNLWLKGGFAEYAVAPASVLANKPAGLTFAQASTIPQAGPIALQGVAGAGTGRRVLINGGGGGSGAFAIQLAVASGALVTAVDNEAKLDFMASLGAAEVLDYRQVDFTTTGDRYDIVLDLVATRPVRSCVRALASGGRYRMVGGTMATLLRVLIGGSVIGPLVGRRVGVLAVKTGPEHFEPLARRCLAGEIDIHIDRTFGLDEVVEALRHVGEGRALGKVVVEP